MLSHDSVLHLLHYPFIFRCLQIQQIHSSIFSHNNTVRVQIAVSLPPPASVELIQTDTDLPEPFKQNFLFQLPAVTQAVNKQLAAFTVHALPALCSMLNKFQDFIHFFHIHFLQPQNAYKNPFRTAQQYFPDPCENHQKLMLKKDFVQICRSVNIIHEFF